MKSRNYKNAKHLAFVRTLPCAVESHECFGSVEAHHLMKPWRGWRGMAMKSGDMNVIPLCHGHHMLLHDLTEIKFFNFMGHPDDFGKNLARSLWMRSPHWESVHDR